MSAAVAKGTAVDEVAVASVDLARAAADEDAGGVVGDHLGHDVEDDGSVTHFFASTDPAYVGWRWAVTLARATGTAEPTVDEVVLLPGEGALLAPAWVPWQERLRPGDLGVGDILPTRADDDRLVPTYAADDWATDRPTADDPQLDDVVVEFGLGRVRVLSRLGRDDAVDRWYAGDAGPQALMAKAAPAQCGTCGFWLPLSGALHGVFGVCANEYASDDAKVVSADHGCGAHSEAMVIAEEEAGPVTPPMDLEEFEVVEPQPPETASLADAPPEELGHS